MCKPVLEAEIKSYEKKIAEMQGDKCKDLIQEETKNLKVNDVFNPNIAWSLKKKLFPKYAEAPFAVFNKNEQLVTDAKSILEVMKEEFTYRLRNRDINDEYQELRDLKEYLCNLRLQITKNSDFIPWTYDNVDKAINKLKNNKCRDPHGHINELYKHLSTLGALIISVTHVCQ